MNIFHISLNAKQKLLINLDEVDIAHKQYVCDLRARQWPILSYAGLHERKVLFTEEREKKTSLVNGHADSNG